MKSQFYMRHAWQLQVARLPALSVGSSLESGNSAGSGWKSGGRLGGLAAA